MRLLPILFVILLARCGPAPAPDATGPVDDLGRSVAVPDSVWRVVSLAPSVTELAVAAGALGRLVGVTDADNYPPAVAGLSRVQALPVNHETVVSLRPDLVLASSQVNDPRDAETLAALGIPTWFVTVRTLADVSRAVRMLGAVLDTRAVAVHAADSLEEVLRGLDAARTERDDPPRVLFLIGEETLFSFGPESYVHDMIQVAGGTSITQDLDTKAPVLSEEFVVDSAPDIIIGAFDARASRLLALHPAWTSVPAIRYGRVYGLDPDLVLRPGPRLMAGTQAIADAIRRSGL